MNYLSKVDSRRTELNARAQTIIDMRLDMDEIKMKQQKQSDLIKSTLLSKAPSQKIILPEISK